MEDKIKSIFVDISEHDMDMLFLEEFASSNEFLKIFTDRINISGYKVVSLQSSKREIDLGESDITVIIQNNNKRIGLLIEDKIDAISMPNQCERYNLRGQKGVENKAYDEFYIFIIAPEKYLLSNSEASKYPNKVKYEDIIEYFNKINNKRSHFKVDQIRFAIEKQKKPYEPIEDPKVTDFWKKYYQFQKDKYPDLYLLYNNEPKGTKASWPRFNTVNKDLYIYHKTGFGYVDLTFDGYGDRLYKIQELLSEINDNYLADGYTINKTGKAAAIRLNVPVIDVHNDFEKQIDNVEQTFLNIRKLSKLAKIININ